MADEYSQAEQQLPFPVGEESAGMSFMSVRWLVNAGDTIPPWWSYARDDFLRRFWKRVDLLGVATSTFESKATTIPFFIKPNDYSVSSHIAQAQMLEENFRTRSGLMRGWRSEFKKFVNDYCTQDNGGFLVIMGGGNPNGPIVGPTSGIYHLDSRQCRRTADPEFPVVYHHSDGKLYRFHYTRIIAISHMPSPETEFNGVGYCPVSAAISAAQELRDMSVHSSEKFGSRPTRQVLYVKKGATIDQLVAAIRTATAKLNSENLDMFSKTLLLAPKTATSELELDTIDLASVPDGFDRMDVTLLDVAIVAAAYGLDMHDVSMAFRTQNATNDNNAEIQDRKGRGKGVGDLLETFTEIMNEKAMPRHLRFGFDQQDDEQDEQQANIWNIRSQARERDLRSGATTVRAERERMLEMNEISEDLFATMELSDGRLPDGTDVVYLFYTDDTYISGLLAIEGVQNPTITSENDPYVILPKIESKIAEVWRSLSNARTANLARKSRQAMAALERLRSLYEGVQQEQEMQIEQGIEETTDLLLEEQSVLNDEATVEAIDTVASQEPEPQFSANGANA